MHHSLFSFGFGCSAFFSFIIYINVFFLSLSSSLLSPNGATELEYYTLYCGEGLAVQRSIMKSLAHNFGRTTTTNKPFIKNKNINKSPAMTTTKKYGLQYNAITNSKALQHPHFVIVFAEMQTLHIIIWLFGFIIKVKQGTV